LLIRTVVGEHLAGLRIDAVGVGPENRILLNLLHITG
jgi:hypothetical protein